MYKIFLILILFSFAVNAQQKKDINIVVSIKPIHSIVSNLTQGVSEPNLLLKYNESPHHFHIKPSQAMMLDKADLIIYIDKYFESGLANILKNYDNSSKLIISELNIKKKYNIRESNKHHKHEHEHGHDEDEDEDTNELDYHLWLDIDNIKYIAKKVYEKLITIDKENANIYDKNLKELNKELTKLDNDITAKMALFTNTEFVNFSDTLQYFEKKYNLKEPLIINYHHGSKPSIKKILNIKKQIKEKQIKCLLYSDEESNSQIEIINQNNSMNAYKISILGNEIDNGPKQYFALMHNITTKIQKCLQ